mmetsp:Transcript_12896/g.24218  ORF Transcript_12896/g.24218 Transcript_12896/m.24218 type:complete len:139 (+) Transcript_12896:153-569(+)
MHPIPKRSPTLRNTIMNSKTNSSSILIRNSISNPMNDDVAELSESAERRFLYDASTWRMYYRILNGRKRRTQVAAMSERNPVSSTAFGNRKENSLENYSKKISKLRNEKKRSLSICSDTTTNNVRDTVRDEEIFALDL